MDSSCMVIKFYQFTKQHITPLTLSLTTLGNTNLFCQSNQSIKGQNTLFSLSRLLMNLWVCSLSLLAIYIQFSSVAQSCLTLLWPHGRQHARPPCPSSTPGAFPNSCPLSRWCHPTISFSVIPFSSCLQSFPASGSSPMSQFFALDGQSTGLSALASVLPMNIQDWFPLGLTGWISLQSKGLSRVFSNTMVQKHQFLGSNSWNWTWNNRLVPNRKRSTSRLYIVTLLI